MEETVLAESRCCSDIKLGICTGCNMCNCRFGSFQLRLQAFIFVSVLFFQVALNK